MMKKSFQESKKSNFLYYGIILVSVLVEVIILWQLERLVPLLYPGFIGFLVFHLLYHLLLFLVAKRSGRLDYLMIWGFSSCSIFFMIPFQACFFQVYLLVCDVSFANSCYLNCFHLVFILNENQRANQEASRRLLKTLF